MATQRCFARGGIAADDEINFNRGAIRRITVVGWKRQHIGCARNPAELLMRRVHRCVANNARVDSRNRSSEVLHQR
jgi:hypothetical protein